ncbi:MAG TPA: divalent-cation tolerance protein CutA [Actinocrinis sp.]|nr:divalent-cation tolerance protein CutA [Actinocrinis sp.]
MSDYVLVTTTTDSVDEAQQLAMSAVEARLAACAQVSAPITSTYWWEGVVEASTEYRIDFKTTADQAERLGQHLRATHSYDVPEVIYVPILGGNPAYLAWISKETAQP